MNEKLSTASKTEDKKTRDFYKQLSVLAETNMYVPN